MIHLFLLEKLIIVTCIAYTFRVLAHYIHISLARYVFLTKNELKQLGLYAPGECKKILLEGNQSN
jgi:hypothetical protein